jgi:GT2 family glycosyltransferase
MKGRKAAVRKTNGNEAGVMKRLHAELHTLQNEMSKHMARIAGLVEDINSEFDDLQETPVAPEARARQDVEFQGLVRRIRSVVKSSLPVGRTVLVVGKAEKELMRLPGAKAWCFPRTSDGAYPGFYPASSTAAIAHLEYLRARGADYLLIPAPCRWWLEHYRELSRHLEHRYRRVVDEADACIIFALRERPKTVGVWHDLSQVLAEFQGRFGRMPAILDCHTGLQIARRLPHEAIFSPPTTDATLAYLNDSVDIVAVNDANPVAAAEAERVASAAVVTIAAGTDGERPLSTRVQWKADGNHRPVTVTIVIPCFNGAEHTDACLTALKETLPHACRVDIIVVDDASSDDTVSRVTAHAKRGLNVEIICNRENSGFIKSCNTGAKASTADFLVFLNNDTLPLPEWLPALLRVLEQHPDAGAVGGKLVHPDGRLQEAGGLIFADGSAANFGRGDYNPDLPVYSFLREVDYCSAALLATPRALFEDIGGFDEHFAPCYYEDVDYCFKVRARGYRVYFQPDSAAIHVEGATAGIDVTVGAKTYQVVNQTKFSERWKTALEEQPQRPERLDADAWQRLARRARSNGSMPR